MLWKLSQSYNFFISEIKGGDKNNAIPREAYAKLSIDKSEKNNFVSELKLEEKNILEEIKSTDPDFKVQIENIKKLKTVFDKDSQIKLLNLLYGLPHLLRPPWVVTL